MKLRNTIILVALFLLLGGYVYFFEMRRSSPAPSPVTMYLYNHEPEDLEAIEVRYRDRSVIMRKDAEGAWHLEQPPAPEADQGRINGTTLALSAVVADKLLTEKPEELTTYGLDRPQIQLDVTAKGGARETLFIGEKNPIASNYYAQRRGDKAIYLVDESWAETVMGLVERPPIAQPTPTPTPGR